MRKRYTKKKFKKKKNKNKNSLPKKSIVTGTIEASLSSDSCISGLGDREVTQL